MELQSLKTEEVVRRLIEISNTSPTTISDILRNIGKMDMLIEVKAVLEKEAE